MTGVRVEACYGALSLLSYPGALIVSTVMCLMSESLVSLGLLRGTTAAPVNVVFLLVSFVSRHGRKGGVFSFGWDCVTGLFAFGILGRHTSLFHMVSNLLHDPTGFPSWFTPA